MNTRARSKRQIGPLTAELLKSLLSYDAETGLFRWLVSPAKNVRAGDIAGSDIGQGYVTIAICGKNYRGHRLAWLYVHGVWPSNILDHINGVRSDNRISNLREASLVLNAWNSRRSPERNSLGVVGVSRSRNKFRALINANKVRYDLGTFASINEAEAAHEAAKARLFPAGEH